MIWFHNQIISQIVGITNDGGMFFSAAMSSAGLTYCTCPGTMGFKRQLGFQTFREPSNHQMGTFPFMNSCQRE